MGTQRVSATTTPEEIRAFTGRLLGDLDRLEELLAEEAFETGHGRIGAELEMFLVDDRFRPAPIGPAVLESVGDPRVSPELGAFNLELNSDPLDLEGGCLSDLETQLVELLDVVREASRVHGVRPVLTGILPTLEARHASPEFMTPSKRYARLDEAMTRLRGKSYRVFIKGIDELNIEHQTVMLEACNTSFQLHLQVDPERFARIYNLGLLALAPLVAISENSPVLFGRRLWRETRIALFQQSVDTRRPGSEHRFFAPRVDFGTGWVKDSVLEIYRDDVARFRAVLHADPEPDLPGETPRLRALQLFNSTIYRWLRPCYGVGSEGPQLRIENRVLPSGPTPVDQMANAAFWYGLLFGLEETLGDPSDQLAFDHVRGNFFAAARLGLGAPIDWVDGSRTSARTLILEKLLDVAAEGLERAGIDPKDSARYLGIIQARAETRQTGSEWALRALESLGSDDGQPWARLTEAILERQIENIPVHEWSIPKPPPRTIEQRLVGSIGAHMQRDLVTAQETDPASLAIHLMRWKPIRHLPIEDDEQRLVGIVTRSTLFRFLASLEAGKTTMTPLSEIMQRNLVTAPPDLSVADAIRLMRSRNVSSIPVVEDGRLVGIVTERDFLGLAAATLIGPEAN